ncbi:MAG: hypothetical protein BGO21_02895 [Dyadobacter sp. 50-39]|nr:MAG: hypothetical protein BGO21_02895 [Dyadobacter sp. 50-39]
MPQLLALFYADRPAWDNNIFFHLWIFLSKRLAEDIVWAYLRRRWESIIRPWMIFVVVCVATQVLQHYLTLTSVWTQASW